MKYLLLLTIALSACSTIQHSKNVKVTPLSQIQWEKLNPARGDKSPQAGTLWGDRKGEVETAFLAKFVDGFSSPPHIHNVSYRAIVIDGLIHNDDPRAENMWMPKGSYWTQPAGEPHITSAKGKNNIAYVEIDKGPYLVKPIDKAFSNNEYPYNIHTSNIIWEKNGSFETASIWKNKKGKVTGRLIKFSRLLVLSAVSARVVLISGEMTTNNKQQNYLKAGSFASLDNSIVDLTCKDSCILYLKTSKKFSLK